MKPSFIKDSKKVRGGWDDEDEQPNQNKNKFSNSNTYGGSSLSNPKTEENKPRTYGRHNNSTQNNTSGNNFSNSTSNTETNYRVVPDKKTYQTMYFCIYLI